MFHEGLERREQPRQAKSAPDVPPPFGHLFYCTAPLTCYLPLVLASHQDAIYTNVADVLISVNPYKNIPLLYEVPLQQMQDEPKDEFEESDGEREVSSPTIVLTGNNNNTATTTTANQRLRQQP